MLNLLPKSYQNKVVKYLFDIYCINKLKKGDTILIVRPDKEITIKILSIKKK